VQRLLLVLLSLVLLFGACGGAKEPDYESGLSRRLGFVDIGSKQAAGFCSIGTSGSSNTGSLTFLTPTAPEEVREGLVRSGGTVASTGDDKSVVTLDGDTYTVTGDDPTKVVVSFKNREKPTFCPKAK
jgi:hypothetical protein